VGNRDPMSREIPAGRIAVRFVMGVVIMSAAFFGSAGTLAWPEAWLYMLVQFGFAAAIAIWLKRHNPDLLKERMIFWKHSARGWDTAIVMTAAGILVPYLLLPGLDAVRYQWSHVPLPVKAIGFAGILMSFALIFWVMRENTYLSRIVEIQQDKGHKVIITGPYRYVRHPMYVGVVVLSLCIPLLLGSLLTLIPGSLLAALIVVRTYLEDKTLYAELDGYKSYANTVRYRLFPKIW